MKKLLAIASLISVCSASLYAQENEKSFIQRGEVHGNFQVEAQYYLEDSVINAPVVPEEMGMNAFGNVNYTNGPISAGLRFEMAST